MKLINLGACRDLLRAWSEVRQMLLRGNVAGFAICVRQHDGDERVVFAGDYQDDREAAAKAAMRMSWELTKAHDFQAGGM